MIYVACDIYKKKALPLPYDQADHTTEYLSSVKEPLASSQKHTSKTCLIFHKHSDLIT